MKRLRQADSATKDAGLQTGGTTTTFQTTQPMAEARGGLKLAAVQGRYFERLLSADRIKRHAFHSCRYGFCEYAAIVKKRHEECGDSAFVYSDRDKALMGVFDGVSGKVNSSLASSAAAQAALEYLRKLPKCNERQMEIAIIRASQAVKAGDTTAVVAFVHKDGMFLIGGVGDSPAYAIDAAGHIAPGISLDKGVADDMPVAAFFKYRHAATASLHKPHKELNPHIWGGKLEKDELLILASDGLSDNLFVKVNDGKVSDSWGMEDLKRILANERSPVKIVRLLADEVANRIARGKVKKPDSILEPNKDDLSILALRFK